MQPAAAGSDVVTDVYGAHILPVPVAPHPPPMPTAAYINGQRVAITGDLPVPAEPLAAPAQHRRGKSEKRTESLYQGPGSRHSY